MKSIEEAKTILLDVHLIKLIDNEKQVLSFSDYIATLIREHLGAHCGETNKQLYKRLKK